MAYFVTHRFRAVLAAVILGSAASGQQPGKPSTAEPQVQQLRRETEHLREELSKLQEQIKQLEATLNWQKFQVSRKQDSSQEITLSTTSRDYQRLDTDNGF